MIDGATYLLSNEYEAALTEQKTGWTAEEILDRVGTRVVTLGPRACGSSARARSRSSSRRWPGLPRSSRPVSATRSDPVSSGAVVAGLPLLSAAQIGCVLAAYVVEQVGTQEYSFTHDEFLATDAQGVRRRGRRAGCRPAPRHCLRPAPGDRPDF